MLGSWNFLCWAGYGKTSIWNHQLVSRLHTGSCWHRHWTSSQWGTSRLVPAVSIPTVPPRRKVFKTNTSTLDRKEMEKRWHFPLLNLVGFYFSFWKLLYDDFNKPRTYQNLHPKSSEKHDAPWYSNHTLGAPEIRVPNTGLLRHKTIAINLDTWHGYLAPFIFFSLYIIYMPA